ncbi:MAG: hypothetical protein ACYSUI_18655 [Planctomycetota bacterium]
MTMSSEEIPQSDNGSPSPTSDQPEVMLCPSCLEQNDPYVDFCRKCGMPIGTFATLDPIKAIHSQGWAYRRAISGRTSPIVFWGMVLIFGPATLFMVFALPWAVWPSSTVHVVQLLLGGGVLSLYAAILYRVTKSYLRYRRARPGRCYECGYRLIGLTEARCPECGTRFDSEEMELDPEDRPE